MSRSPENPTKNDIDVSGLSVSELAELLIKISDELKLRDMENAE